MMRVVAADHANQPSVSFRRRRLLRNSKRRQGAGGAGVADDQQEVTANSSTDSSSGDSSSLEDIYDRHSASRRDDRGRLFPSDHGMPHRLVDFFCVIGVHQATSAAFSRNARKGQQTHYFQQHQQQWSAFSQEEKKDDDVWSQSSASANKLHPQVLDCYPKERPGVVFPAQVPKFVFPNGFQIVEATKQPEATTFTFTLTLGSGRRMYASALTFYETIQEKKRRRREEDDSDNCTSHATTHFYLPKCLVVLSHYPFFDVFSTFLRQVYGSFAVLQFASLPLERWIANFCHDVPLPPRGKAVIQWDGIPEVAAAFAGSSGRASRRNSYYITRPAPNQFPLVNFSYQPLFRTLSIANILVVWGCLLQEGKVVLCCRHSSILTPVAEALLSLLFPLEWQGMYIPILPQEYVGFDVLEAPVPFLVGLPHGTEALSAAAAASSSPGGRHRRPSASTSGRRMSWHPPRGVVVVDLDRDMVHLGWDETTGRPKKMPDLPDRESMNLKIQLEELVDHLYLVPSCGMKGRLTTGAYPIAANHNNHEDEMLDNSSREPYSQVTRVIIGSGNGGSSKGNSGNTSKRKIQQQQQQQQVRGSPRGRQQKQHSNSSFGSTGSSSSHDQGSARNWIMGRASRVFIRDDDAERMKQRAEQQQSNFGVVGDDNAVASSAPPPSNLQEEPITRRVSDLSSTSFLQSIQPATRTTLEQDEREKSDFMKSLHRHSKVMQAHTDRLLAFAGQRYSTRDSSVSESKQSMVVDDEQEEWMDIAASFFSLADSDLCASSEDSSKKQKDNNGIHGLPAYRVRFAFFSFFIQMFARYRKFLKVDATTKTPRFDTKDFLNELNLSDRNRRYMSDVVKTQMFERFLHAAGETTSNTASTMSPSSPQRKRRSLPGKQEQPQREKRDRVKLRHPVHPQVLLLDEYILARKNRSSSMNFSSGSGHRNKQATPFLSDTTSWRIRKVIVPAAPSTRGLLPVLYGKRRYNYNGQVFPALKKEELISSSHVAKSCTVIGNCQDGYMCTIWSSLSAFNCTSSSSSSTSSSLFASCAAAFSICTG